MFKKLKPKKKSNLKPKRLKLPKLPKMNFKGVKKQKTSGKDIKAKTNYISLKYKLIGSLVIFASLPVIIVSILSVTANVKAIENSVGSYSQRMVQQFGYSFDNMIDQARNTITQFMLMDDGIKKMTLELDSDDKYEVYKRDLDINNQIQTLLNGNNMLNGIIVVNSNGKVYFKDEYSALKEEVENLKENDIFKTDLAKAIEENSGPYWFNTIDGKKMGAYVAWHYKSYSTDVDGIVIVSVGMKQPTQLIETFNIEDVSDFYIMNKDKEVILSTDENVIGTELELAYLEDVYGENDDTTFIHSGELVSCYTFKNGWHAVYRAPLSALMKDVTEARNMTIMVAVICIALAIVIGFVIAVSISKPINRLRQVMAEAETGNLNVEYTFKGNNEIGQLVRSFNNMISNIKALILDTKNVAETIEQKTETLQVVSESTATSANQITQAIESIATGTESQTTQIVQSSQMMNNLSENINVATKKVQDVQEVANDTMNVSNESVSIMEELNKQAAQTIEISAEIERQIEDLGNEAEQITHVVAMIQSISEQTNLLALNATIEAARAGEAGRGFGVVADEIRKLANQSKEATSTIENIITSIMEKKDTSIKGAREATNLFSLQRPIVDHTNEAFAKINQEMERVVEELDDLRDLFGQITQHKDDTVVAITEISDIIGHSASAAEEVFATSAEQSTSAEQIADMANTLLKGVEELKLAQQKFRI